MNIKIQTLKITKGKNIKESKDLEPISHEKKKKETTQRRNIRERYVTIKRIIFGYRMVVEIYQTSSNVAKAKAKIQF